MGSHLYLVRGTGLVLAFRHSGKLRILIRMVSVPGALKLALRRDVK
jgi:hypothetical protein